MKNIIRRSAALALAAVMLFALCACGDGSKNQAGKEPVPEFSYESAFTRINTPKGTSVYSSYANADGFYWSTSEKIGEKVPEGAVIEYEGQYDVYGNVLYRIGFDGSMTRLAKYTDIEAWSDEHNTSSYISSMCSDGEGGLILLTNVYESWNDAPEGVEMYTDEWYGYSNYKENWFLRRVDAEGAELSCAQLDIPEDSGFYVYDMAPAPDGGVLCACDSEGVVCFGLDGKEKYRISTDNWVDNLVTGKDGKIYAFAYEDGYVLREIDLSAGSFGEAVKLPDNAYNVIDGGGDYDLWYTSGSTVYGFDVATGEGSKLFGWIACDVNNDNMGATYIDEDGTVYVITNEWDSNYENCESSIVTITRRPYDPTTAKQTLVLATGYLDWNFKNEIIRFNRTNDKVRVDVNEYDDPDQLYTEIMAGKLPDLIDLSYVSQNKLAAKGLLEDLMPYIEADSGINSDDFFPGVFSAMQKDGKLYSACGSFGINAVIGASSVVGSEPGWNYEQFNAALASMPEGCEPFDSYTTRSDLLTYSLSLDMDSFVDWKSGKCSFDTPEFKQLLTWLSGFENKEFDWENYTPDDDSWTRISEGRQMLLATGIYYLDDILQYDSLFGGDCTYIGYPTAFGTGNLLSFSSGYGMTTACRDKEAAWKLLRVLFTPEFQKQTWGLPLSRSRFNEMLEEAMTPQYQTDENGNYVLDENGNKIELPLYSYGMGDEFGGMRNIDVYAMSQEQADKLVDLINSTTKISDADTSIYEIVATEAEPFFAGQKSVDEVASIIQSKASIYVNEQR